MGSQPQDGGGIGEGGGRRKGERRSIVVGYPDMSVWREKKRPILSREVQNSRFCHFLSILASNSVLFYSGLGGV